MSAFAIRYARVCCDHPKCPMEFEISGTITDARRAAIAVGWIHAIRKRLDSGPAPTFDFCPRHHDDLERFGAVAVVLTPAARL